MVTTKPCFNKPIYNTQILYKIGGVPKVGHLPELAPCRFKMHCFQADGAVFSHNLAVNRAGQW